jgi:hypothetical protein
MQHNVESRPIIGVTTCLIPCPLGEILAQVRFELICAIAPSTGMAAIYAHSRRLVKRTLRIAAVDVTVEREAVTDPGSPSGGIAVAVEWADL